MRVRAGPLVFQVPSLPAGPLAAGRNHIPTIPARRSQADGAGLGVQLVAVLKVPVRVPAAWPSVLTRLTVTLPVSVEPDTVEMVSVPDEIP